VIEDHDDDPVLEGERSPITSLSFDEQVGLVA
jgi:hypothetical protein